MKITIGICKLVLFIFIVFNLIMLGQYGLKQPDASRAIFYGVLAILDYLLFNDMSED